MKIKEARVWKETKPLKKPYVLSFAVLDEFVSLRVEIIREDNQRRTAEVVPLFGYSSENEASIFEFLEQISQEIDGKEMSLVRTDVSRLVKHKPFSTTAILTAIDLFDFEVEETWQDYSDFVIPADTVNLAELRRIQAWCLEKNAVLKLKLSGDVEQDLNALKVLDENVEGSKLMRLDANQGFDLLNARKFLEGVSDLHFANRIQYIEQMLESDHWESVSLLCQEFPHIAQMLDESIIAEEHVDAAKLAGVKFIKLKLFKQGGIRELINIARYANDQGLKVILGNGVATDLSNQVETSVYLRNPNLFVEPLESNGYIKVE